MKTLSILICSLAERAQQLRKLLDILEPQLTPEIELLIETDNRQKRTGTKRQILLEKASGTYCCFIDDDDLVSPTYCNDILNALSSQPDCVGFKLFRTKDNIECVYSIKNKNYHFRQKSRQCTRPITHINPVKTAYARRIGFQPIDWEDIHYAEWLERSKLLQKEVFINKCLYIYNNR